MGVIQEEYLIVQSVFDKEEIILDRWIEKVEEEWRGLFFKCPTHSNGHVTYFMNWDGSKEGWESSEKGNSLRESFIQLVLDNCLCAEVLHIKPKGECIQEDSIERRESSNIEDIESPCVVCQKYEEVENGMCEGCLHDAITEFKLKHSPKAEEKLQ